MKTKNYIPYKYLRDYDRSTPKLLEYLFNGGNDKDKIKEMAEEGLSLIDQKYDCSDFRVEIFIRILYSFKNVIGSEVEEMIVKTLKDFPFDDTTNNSMCTWTENHQLIFSVSEYLFGQMYPDMIMYNGQTGSFSFARARDRMKEWCEYIYKFGFSEFGSCNYYPETFAALGNIIEFSQEHSIRKKFRIILDLLCYDVLSQTTPDYTYNIATARAYVDNKTNYRNYMKPIIKALLGEEITINHEREACFYLMLKAKNKQGKPFYELPKVFKNIFESKERIIKTSNGLELIDYAKHGLLTYKESNIRYALASGALVDYRTASNIVRYFDEKDMWKNSMIKGLKPFKDMIQNRTSLFKIFKGLMRTTADDMAFGRGNTYTYVNNNYSISSLQKYHLHGGSFQQVTHMINLDGLSVFSLSPSKPMSETGSPDYWIGSYSNPHCVQVKNQLITMYKFREHNKYGSFKTHLYYPLEKFDEVNLEYMKNGYLFSRYHGINLMVKTNKEIEFVDSTFDSSIRQDDKMVKFNLKKYDLLNTHSGKHYYIYVVDDTKSFEEFIKDSLNTNYERNSYNIKFGDFNFTYDKDTFFKGEKVDNRYQRYEGDYISGNSYDYNIKKPLIFVCGKDSLKIDFKNYRRKEEVIDD